ncbi:SRPBCC family protein [Solitalea canadensis]|uniref:Polyketide cyclase / dehydrase and lipid transport n=1 Tax=Solitalea canadensis (strain ATCC 29591 / DSM 3403 / JCM 21819 / LMG 8368 / NBRC 15130 / NCIMB 12057 / USAM 9D) TaxID=929556 RepID=H8KX93_SOLCM|nr:polyketide cyclase / dehydrase and lipid transport [Solitalea canadensis]AFD08422.1 Polyketide cyclase / dehydrase and lipid transport [Solitalea canadensis DSM 3403]
MKKILFSALILSLVVIASPKHAHAQMGAAQTIQWDITKVAVVKADQDGAWSLLSNLREIKMYTKGYISDVEIKGSELPFDRIITFADGTKRTEQIDQVDQRYKFMAYQFKENSLPAGITQVNIAVFTKAVDDKAEVKWVVRVDGKGDAKKALVAQLTAEIDKYAEGMTNLFKNSIPAMQMN